MATKKKRKTSSRKKKASKKAELFRVHHTASYLSKLDPTLRLGALRARQEKMLPGVEAPQEGAVEVQSVTDLNVGMHSLAAQMSPRGVARFAEEDLVSVLVDCARPKSVAEAVHEWGGDCRALTGSTMTARVPRTRLESLARMGAVRYVEASTRLKLHLDRAHISSGLVQDSARSVPQRGAGVLLGVVDTGIDVRHPAFRAGGRTRIVSYLDQFRDALFDADQIDAGEADASTDTVGHGTHVAGIAAGNGAGSPARSLAGVAPEADLAVVKSTLETADIVEGIAHLFELADARDQPCVVNASFGGHFGGHDGSTVLERTIDALSGPGRIVVVSAGNEGNDPIHAHNVLRGDGAEPARWEAGLRLNARTFPTDSGPVELGILVVQLWHQREDALSVTLRAPGGPVIEPPDEGSNEFDLGSFLVTASRQRHPVSGDPSVSFEILTLPQPQWLGGWSLVVEEQDTGSAEVGAVHAWIRDVAEGSFTTGATFDYLVGMPATAYSAVTVASYTTRREWSSRDPSNPTVRLDGIELDAISSFSSPGPTRDGQNKPEVSAPGEWLIAPLSRDAPLSELPLFTRIAGIDYASLRGTSMSAPYVSGALALLLEKEPTVGWAEAKRRLIKSARQDRKTGVAWNRHWGYGKLDVERLLTIEPGA